MPEYIWGYEDSKIPPLVVRVKDKGVQNRVAWEHLKSFRKSNVIDWKVSCMDSGESLLASVSENHLMHEDYSGSGSFAAKATYQDGDSGYAYIESSE